MRNKRAGSRTNAIVTLLQGVTLTDEQIKELEEILEKSKENEWNKK